MSGIAVVVVVFAAMTMVVSSGGGVGGVPIEKAISLEEAAVLTDAMVARLATLVPEFTPEELAEMPLEMALRVLAGPQTDEERREAEDERQRGHDDPARRPPGCAFGVMRRGAIRERSTSGLR